MNETAEERKERSALKTLKNLKRGAIIAAVAVVILGILLGLAWKAGQKKSEKKYESTIKQLQEENQKLIDNPVVIEPVTPEIDLTVVNSEIRNIGELATMEYFYTNAARYSDARKVWGFEFAEKSFVLKWDGVIKAGVDVKQITTELDSQNKVLTVILPKAKILSHDPDLDSAEVVDQKNGLFNPVTVEDQTKFSAECEKAMEAKAIERGLLEQAQENAEKLLEELLSQIPGLKEGGYQMQFQTAAK